MISAKSAASADGVEPGEPRQAGEERVNGSTITVGDLRFELRHSTRRKAVQITVDRGGELVRPHLSFQSLDDVLKEAERLSRVDAHPLGSWSLGQALDHLAPWMEFSIDGVPAHVGWPLRLLLRPFRKQIIRRPMRSGFRWPADADPRLVPQEPVGKKDGLEHLRRAVARLRAEPQRAPSPLLGQLTAEEWEQLHLRHAEHHLSFVLRYTLPRKCLIS